ncbi:cupin domain-containing protein [Defluviimonas salinarum]|uniref:Cupin domain-containing protein n=1 Tax=Defluviimonas salinarum TaxID=2992147 RepID=A0ABT3IZQ5_9RHOB|nr:cupin domain-containing protein [Defluviimonas salinarum]MCW3780900.1 cupin domain-containing protein [Defluviimonas salinarum]
MTEPMMIPDAAEALMIGATDLPEPVNSPAPPAPQGFSVDAAEVALEGGTDPVFGSVTWRTLICADRTQTQEFVLGIAEFGPAGTLHPHRHAPAEFYLCIEGGGTVTIDGIAHALVPGVAVYIPGNAEHGVIAGPTGLRFAYGFAEAAFSGVAYRFSSAAA